ncbi:hypothetical protein JI435_071560 [Parastagonospora nodorum SN15]|uniref:Uncharacterized protein n=1 Tax=Phaeosphaeria nodorum (strain SN15 / ATCC MYA-4574 / FGSC 10173) TaxID=321614 RepID=A0A7U2F7Q1_PHANO|nr:hypothetical protein JI435_071560 [Parastagonospora nodorum SN15]
MCAAIGKTGGWLLTPFYKRTEALINMCNFAEIVIPIRCECRCGAEGEGQVTTAHPENPI